MDFIDSSLDDGPDRASTQSNGPELNLRNISQIHTPSSNLYFYTQQEASVLEYAAENRFVKVSGFQFCSILGISLPDYITI